MITFISSKEEELFGCVCSFVGVFAELIKLLLTDFDKSL